MKSNPSFRFSIIVTVLVLLGGARFAAADSTHARVVRLRYAQGDVRFARSAGADSLTDTTVTWEAASLNLPIRQGYVLGTASGRAAVEFEYGNTLAYLDENTVLEFPELSLNDGARSTRLVLRQGTAGFIVLTAPGESFVVAAGDATLKVEEGANFRVDVYDEGVTIGIKRGHATLTAGSQTKALEEGQSVTVRNAGKGELEVQPLPARDDFDEWVSDAQDSLTAAYTASTPYVSMMNYSYGFADLFTYGYWFGCPGYPYAYCWRPYGVGLGWRPFRRGCFIHERRFGLAWLSRERWGWLPYHHGAWLFSPALGWMWSPGLNPRVGMDAWRPFTGTLVRSGERVGIVPMHPMDAAGKTPLNLPHGVIAPAEKEYSGAAVLSGTPGNEWRAVKSASAGLLPLETPREVAAPPTGSRPFLARARGTRFVSLGGDSSIVYDRVERKFVNAERFVRSADEQAAGGTRAAPGAPGTPLHRAGLGRPPVGFAPPAAPRSLPGPASRPPAASGGTRPPAGSHPSSAPSSHPSSSSGSRGSSGGGGRPH